MKEINKFLYCLLNDFSYHNLRRFKPKDTFFCKHKHT
jgi:hypothetical protein